MDKIKLLHIGDIHYPDNKDLHSIDIKDKGVSPEFLKTISPNCFNKVSIQIIEAIKKYDIDIILFSGDLTSRGDYEQYDLCVKYLMNLLSKESIGKDIEIHVVPGNHDIDRRSLKKFEIFANSWKDQGLDILTPYDVRASLITKNKSKLKIASLNTCIGCGEFRGFPEKIKIEINTLLDNANLENKTHFDVFGESLDTPAASQDDIQKIESIINQCKEDNSIPLILGHHGILPQATIRVDVYTEMINGGYIRTMLNSCEHPVIYCHGHIHDDPVEVITQPQYPSSVLISISAPAFTDGFNIIEFDYLGNGTSLGCTIKTFKIRNYSGLKLDREIRVPLKKPDSLEKYADKNLEEAFKILPSELVFYKDLVNEWNKNNSEIDLKGMLVTLEWLGILVIDNRDKPESLWIIRRIGI